MPRLPGEEPGGGAAQDAGEADARLPEQAAGGAETERQAVKRTFDMPSKLYRFRPGAFTSSRRGKAWTPQRCAAKSAEMKRWWAEKRKKENL